MADGGCATPCACPRRTPAGRRVVRQGAGTEVGAGTCPAPARSLQRLEAEAAPKTELHLPGTPPSLRGMRLSFVNPEILLKKVFDFGYHI